MTQPRIFVTDQTISVEHAVRLVAAYIAGRGTGGTFRAIDLRPRQVGSQLTGEDVALTRKMYSRISREQEKWFLDRSYDAPWESVTPVENLLDMDPDADAGRDLHARANGLFEHFRCPSQPGVGTAKIHKVLHVMRPRLFPILDGRLQYQYRLPARNAAASYGLLHPELLASSCGQPYRHLFWLAIRDDLTRSLSALTILRSDLLGKGVWKDLERPQSDLERVSDVRLLDIIAWKIA